MLTYRWSSDLTCIGYLDFDFVGCPNEKKSTIKYVFKLIGGTVLWKNIKQSLITTFTMETEYVSCYEATQEAIWLRNFISEFCLIESISRPLTIYYDNTIAMSFSQNNKTSTCTKHFDVKYQFVREKMHEYLTQIKYVLLDYILVHPLTKAFVVGMFKRYVLGMVLIKSFNVLG